MGAETEEVKPSTGVFRSEKMLLVHLLLQPTIVFDATAELGTAGLVEFRELNPTQNAYQRTYVDEVRRTEEIDRKLHYLLTELKKEPTVSLIHDDFVEPPVPKYREIIRLESNIEELDRNLRDVTSHLRTLMVKRIELLEFNHVLAKTFRIVEFARVRGSLIPGSQQFQAASSFDVSDRDQTAAAMFRRSSGAHKLNTITGVIDAAKAKSFHTMIWRVCSNNALVQFYDIQEPIEDLESGDHIPKKVFLVMCQGDVLFGKIRKISAAYHANCFDVPADSVAYKQVSTYVSTNLKDMNTVIDQTRKQRVRMLAAMALPENVPTWRVQIVKLKATFSAMNLFRKTERGFVAEGWIAKTDFHILEKRIESVVQRSGVAGQAAIEIVSNKLTPPTYFRTNKFTQGFQNIVDSYGIASYREMNPAPYAAITFPFLFAIMFADAGHGVIMLLFALWMVLFEKKLASASNNEIWLTFFEGRYIILLMGGFSIYTGMIYNDIFAKSMNLFGTSFKIPIEPYATPNGTEFPKDFYLEKTDSVYAYGVDSIWQLSENKILFLNSFKMKLSVTLGVLQMLFGVGLSFLNHRQFKDRLSIFCEFIPQIVFLLGLFGYMIGLIFAKWIMVWDPPARAPSILIDFINMFLMKYPDEPEYLTPWFPNKQQIQTFLLASALLCVPFMLLVKPTILVCSKPKKHTEGDDEESAGSADDHGESALDIYIHQAIHTIEYCLGSISHTASYLRLWALSLAHSQLSEVLWSMVLRNGLTADFSSKFQNPWARYSAQGVQLLVSFGAWATLTVSILIVMEGLSAFLHALRLHWVEFMSKFYRGTGYVFKPFNFADVVAQLE